MHNIHQCLSCSFEYQCCGLHNNDSYRRKAKLKGGHDLQLTNLAERSRDTDSMYEDVTGHLPSASAINTQDNVAYGRTHKQQN
jgi:hypothetical protein